MLPNIANKKNVTVNDRPYPVIEAGDGPLVVCLHGFPDNSETWQHQIETFVAAGYRIVCPAMPGFAPGVLKSCLSYYRNSNYGLNGASFKFRRLFNGRIDVPTLGIRGKVDSCIAEVAWELTSPKFFRAELTLEIMPGDIGHFPQLESPQWVSERLIRWVSQYSD